MVPAQFKTQQGQVKMGDLALAATWLHVIDVPPVPNIPDVFVIKGRVGLMAGLQIALAERDGYEIEVVTSTAKMATVRIRQIGAKDWKPYVTVTYAQAEQAGWTKRSANSPDQPSNYELMPDRMLAARAVTKAIGFYAPGVRRGIRARAAGVADLADEEDGEITDGSGPGTAGSEPSATLPPPPDQPPGRRADGPTLPEHLRPPECSEELRADLLARLAVLEGAEPEALAELRDRIAFLKIPNLRKGGPDFTEAHGWLLDRLFRDIEAPAPTDEAVPPVVHDDAPDAAGYGPDDPGRPFE